MAGPQAQGFRVVIPARYASTRLPGKPLADIAGKPMLQHVVERAASSGAAEVIVATDDPRIEAAAVDFGATVCMTAPTHCSGTERVAEVIRRIGAQVEDIIVNLQGDEPLIPPALLRQVAGNLAARGQADVATLCEPITDAAALHDPNVVKVVADVEGFALYFSRAVVPWHRDHFAAQPGTLPGRDSHYRHIGIYAYRAGFLQRYVSEAPCALEQVEALEQLRVLYMGGCIHVAVAVEPPGPGVDTEVDLQRVRELVNEEATPGRQ